METRRWRGKGGKAGKQFSKALQNHHGRRMLGGGFETCVCVCWEEVGVKEWVTKMDSKSVLGRILALP